MWAAYGHELPPLEQVDDADVAVVEADAEQLRTARVELQADDAVFGRVDVLREARVLERTHEHHAVRRLQELVCTARRRTQQSDQIRTGQNREHNAGIAFSEVRSGR